jgi:uncharacterized membrane protein
MQFNKETILILSIFAAVGSGAMGGLLFAFSNFVMKSIALQPIESGIRTMQAINIHILNPLFFTLFLGTALAAGALAFDCLFGSSRAGTSFVLLGSAFYLVGTLGVTLAFNVPLNNTLATQHPNTPEAAQFWSTYVAAWLKWNHVRTFAALAAAVAYVLAISKM